MLHLRSLTHLVTLAERLNFARAAEDLGLSQSALSRSIQALERQLGMTLFDRDRSGVALTPQGARAVARAAILLADAEDCERELTLNASADAGRVRFGMAPMPARALLPAVVAERLRVAPEAVNEVVVRDGDALWALLLTGEIEFFVCNEGFAFDTPTPRVERLGLFPLSAIVRAGHPLLHGDCPGATFPVLRSSWTGVPLPREIGERMECAPNVIEDFGSLAAITAASDAIWFSSSYAALPELADGSLCQLPHREPRHVGVSLYSLERRSPSPLARSLKQLLRARIRALTRAQDGEAVAASPV
ncbi:LysR family transcriptional regulator [Sphingomonas naphthae]|uniref:LysR family transcriptional regulator n=1 Tax=Sphingomonas naphthae TaxID=1813468 RepID=A0ABY7TKL7_9SPHN|nr:LysR family transcriptional regulator [Sphingomonas naphthae]WCT73493.1 LysR family transcriptional regulator [Sphingomonas naphthae]